MPIIYDPAGTTFGDVIEEITSGLQGYTASPDQVTSLSAALTSAALTVPVDDASVGGRGLVEVGTELMWVQTVDRTGGTFTVLPKGRGWRGTRATTHQAGDTVVVSPAIPRSVVAREVNNQLRALYPDMFGVATTTFVHSSNVKAAWGIPAEAEVILDVRWKDYRGNWERVRRWEAESGMDLTDFPSGLSLRIAGVPIGRTVQVVYGFLPLTLSNESDLFSSTGLSAGAKDLVVLGTMCRVIPNLDASRLSVQYASAEEMNQARPPGGAMAIAKYFQAQYAIRLRQEREAINANFPARVHITR